MGPGFFPGGKAAEDMALTTQTPFPRFELKERVKLYLYPPPRAFMACSRVNFTVYRLQKLRVSFENREKFDKFS
jgi:hypothetical protein